MNPYPGANSAPRIVPSQWSSTSHPSNILAGACSRCGRATEPGNVWNICGPCAAGGARPGVVMGPGPSSSVKPYPTANCTACRVAFRVPSHPFFQTAHVLCPPCQVLHGAGRVKPNPQDRVAPRTNPSRAVVQPTPQDRAAPRANPYPVVQPIAKTSRAPQDRVALRTNPYSVVPPIPKTSRTPQDRDAPRTNPYPVVPPIAKMPRSLASTLAFTYPNLLAPPPPSALESVNHGRDVPRECMRFGCRARLPAHVRGDMCEACARAGFLRPPPAVIQKRVPRRATERTCPRPRESLEVVRASLLPETAHGSKVSTESRNVENESETELVYPDDIPVAIQYVSTIPDATRELKPLEDEDVDLELVYPEDAAKVSTSSSKAQTESSPPTTLRELFKDGLQAIPALQNLAVVAHRSPPRRCRMPGCNEVLRAQTCMQRCVKCSVGAWKRRTSATMDTLGPSRRPSASLPMTDSSMEAKKVTNMLEEISDVEDDLPSSSPSKSSSNDSTGDQGISPIPGWDSDLTEFSCSDSDAEDTSDFGPKPGPMLASPHGGTTDLRIHIPLLATRLPPGSPLRKCGSKRCNIALPKGHRWKTCDPCRRAQRMRFENERRSIMRLERMKSPNLSCQRWRSFSPDMRETDVSLTTETSRPCSVTHCRSRIPLSEVYRCKTCTSCRARARREARRKRDALLETQHASRPPEVVPRFPAYQNRGALLSSFDAQIKGFVEGQIMYFRAKLHDSGGGSQEGSEPWKPQHTPMTFVFVGEYSMVTGQRGDIERSSHDPDPYSKRPNKPGELEAMRQEVSNIVLDLECLLRAKFRSEEAFAIDKGGIIMRFTSSLELIAQLRPLAATVDRGPVLGLPCASDSEASTSKGEDTSRKDALLTVKPPPSPPTVPLVKTFSGELEAIVVPDESHHLFRGRRTVVRYCMVG